MEELDSKINLWVRERLIPRLIEEDEPNAKFSISRPTGSFFVSGLFFVTVHSVKNGDKSVVVKLPWQDLNVATTIVYDELFANEILFYNQIAHMHNEDYPNCYTTGKDPTFKNFIILEDVRARGYTVSPKKVNVNVDYIVAGLKSIGRFHGHTYAVKEKEPVRFHEIVKSVLNSRYKKNGFMQDILNDEMPRVLRAFRAKHHDSEFTATVCKVFENTYDNVVLKCVEPKEPLATIVHGDCTINNMLFRRKDDGKLETMLIDFGMVMNSSPAIDVAMFLYTTCKLQDIRNHTEELFNVYHDSLTECMKEHGIWDSSKYSRQAFWQEYRDRAIFGYVSGAVFFRPVMIIYERDNAIPDMNEGLIERFFGTDTDRDFLDLVDMLDHLRITGMLDHLIYKSDE